MILLLKNIEAFNIKKILFADEKFIFDENNLDSIYQKIYQYISNCIEKEKASKKNKKTYEYNTFFKFKISRERLNEELNLNEDNFFHFLRKL